MQRRRELTGSEIKELLANINQLLAKKRAKGTFRSAKKADYGYYR